MTADMGSDSVARKVIMAYTYVAVWIGLSGAVIMFNKYLLAYGGFPYPVTLTMWHMFFCAALAIGLVRGGYVSSINMDRETYLKAIVPIGACYAGTLWVGNAAYLYLSVSFIQMLKALMPVAVFSVGCVFGTERFSWPVMSNMILVTIGVAIASFGEINFNIVGVAFQLGSVVIESIRLVLVQLLLQLYYVAPCCFCFLLIPFLALEAGKIAGDDSVVISPLLLLANAAVAFCLNMAVFLLIGKTSALTMNIGGVVKDWLLIGLSVWMFQSAVSKLNLFGYAIAFLAVCWYNWQKLESMKQKEVVPIKSVPDLQLFEKQPLKNNSGTLYRAVPLVCRRFRRLSLAQPLLRHLTIHLSDDRAMGRFISKLRSLCDWVLLHTAGHVQILELHLDWVEYMPKGGNAEVQVLLAGMLVACGSAGSLQELCVVSRVGIAVTNWVATVRGLRRLEVRVQCRVDGHCLIVSMRAHGRSLHCTTRVILAHSPLSFQIRGAGVDFESGLTASLTALTALEALHLGALDWYRMGCSGPRQGPVLPRSITSLTLEWMHNPLSTWLRFNFNGAAAVLLLIMRCSACRAPPQFIGLRRLMFTRLRRLELLTPLGMSRAWDFEPLADLPALEALCLSSCDHLPSPRYLARMTALRHLALSASPRCGNAAAATAVEEELRAALAAVPQLTCLELSPVDYLCSWSPAIASMGNLHGLCLCPNHHQPLLGTLPPMPQLPSLRWAVLPAAAAAAATRGAPPPLAAATRLESLVVKTGYTTAFDAARPDLLGVLCWAADHTSLRRLAIPFAADSRISDAAEAARQRNPGLSVASDVRGELERWSANCSERQLLINSS
eukprot:scaffold20.g7875.t1